MNCTKCGAELSPGAKFCEKCGNSIPEQTFTCQKCLNPLKKNQKFCGECGSEIDPTIYLPKNNVCKGKTKDGNLCGATVNTDVKFCSKCGHCQHAEEPAAKPEEQAASSIGEHTTGIQEANPDRKSGDKDLQQQSSSDLEKTSKSKKKKKKKKKGKEKVKPEDETNHGNGKEKAESTLEGTTTSNGRDDRKEKEKENAQPRENSHSDSHDDQYMQKKNENPSSEEKLLGDDNDNQQENDKPSSEQKLLDDDKANKQVKENAKPRENTSSGSHNDQHTQKENKGSNAEENILDDDNDNGNQQEKENSKPRENTRSDSHDDQYMQKENKKPNSEKKLLDDDNDNGNQQENKRPNSEEKLLDDNNDNSNQEEKENVKPMENSRSDCHDDQYMQKENKRPNSEEKLLDDVNDNGNQQGKEESTPIEKARSEENNDLKTQVITSTIPEIGHQSSGSRSGSGAKRKHKGMGVIFYAALVEQFIDNKSAETVCLQFDFGRAKMRYIGSFTIDDEVFHKYEASVVFSEPISNDKVYNYNYFVTRTNGEEVMEYVHNNGTNVKCRTIHFRNSSTNAIQHRHDGIVRGKQVYSKGMFTKAFSGVVNYFTGNEKNDQKLLRKDAENAIKIYTSLLRIDSIGPEDIDKSYREIIDNVLLNLRRRYYIEEYLWSQTEDFEKFAGKVMRPHIQQCLRDLIMKRNQDIDVQLQVLCMKTSITVLCLVLSYKVELSAEERFMLCSSLLPYLGKDTSKCEDMEAVKISVNTTRKLAEYIIALMRSVIKESKPHPCWMFCVPLLHFLQDKYVPYQEVPVLSNHKDGNPTWWGIESFITEIQTFKRKNPWDKALLNDFSRKLAPYFQLDYFLPRTLIATFYVTDLNNVKELGVPEDAVLASLYYHIALARYISTQFAVESRDIATKVSTSLCSLTKNKRYSIKDAERLNCIAEDLISVCLKKKNDLFLKHKFATISIAEVYFASVHWLNNGLSLEGQDDNEPLKYYQRIAAFEEHVNLFCKFVNPTPKHRGAADLEKWLEEWSTPFEMKIPDGDVKNHIDLQLKKVQEEELQKMKYHPNDIIMIYCNSAESFPSQTQELLSRYAFKVLDQCKNLESVEGKLQNDNRRQKTFGILLSNVFERSLDEKKMQDDNNLLFMHALSWAPFATFAKLFCTYWHTIKL